MAAGAAWAQEMHVTPATANIIPRTHVINPTSVDVKMLEMLCCWVLQNRDCWARRMHLRTPAWLRRRMMARRTWLVAAHAAHLLTAMLEGDWMRESHRHLPSPWAVVTHGSRRQHQHRSGSLVQAAWTAGLLQNRHAVDPTDVQHWV